MKKIISLFLAIAMGISLVSCSTGSQNTINSPGGSNATGDKSGASSSPNSSEGSYTVPDSVMNMIWAAGPTGGVTYPLGAAVSEMISTKLAPGAQITLLEGAGASNIELVNSGEAMMGHTMGDTAFCAINGMAPFDGPKDNFYTWARVSDFQFQFVVPASLGISSFEEIKEKNIVLNLGTNTYGSSAEAITRLVLESYGITYEWIEANGGSTTFTSFADGVVLMQDGHINAWGALSAAPNSFIQEMNLSQQMTILPVDQKIMEEMAATYGYAIGTVPANSYEGITKEIPTLLSPMVLICNGDLPEDFVYAMTKSLFEEEMFANLIAVSSTFSEVAPAYSGINLGAPLHPGAEKFYKEAGVL